MTPTTETIKKLKRDGYTVAIVEKWNAFAKIRQDLFGFIDVLAIRKGEILGIQTTSRANVNARIKKSLASPHLKTWLLAGGRFEVWGWSKKGKRGQRKLWEVYPVAFRINTKNKPKPIYPIAIVC